MSQTNEEKSSPPSKTVSIAQAPAQILTKTFDASKQPPSVKVPLVGSVRIELFMDSSSRITIAGAGQIKPALLEHAVDRMYRVLTSEKVKLANRG